MGSSPSTISKHQYCIHYYCEDNSRNYFSVNDFDDYGVSSATTNTHQYSLRLPLLTSGLVSLLLTYGVSRSHSSSRKQK